MVSPCVAVAVIISHVKTKYRTKLFVIIKIETENCRKTVKDNIDQYFWLKTISYVTPFAIFIVRYCLFCFTSLLDWFFYLILAV